MGLFSFLFGAFLGGGGTYYYLREQSETSGGNDYAAKQKLADAEAQIQTLKSRLADYEGLKKELNASKAELQRVTDQLTASRKELETLRGRPAEETPQAQPEPEAATEPSAPEPSATPVEPDDLRKINGIGPKVAQLLLDAGISSYTQLAQTGVDRLRVILEEAGGAFKGMNPETWPEQAGFAAKGDWEALKKYSS